MSKAGYVLLSAGVFLADQVAKRHSRRWYYGGITQTIGKGKISVKLQNVRNKGAVLNLGEDHAKTVKWISVISSIVLSCVYVYLLGKKGKKLLKTGFSLFLGGAWSNALDRIRDGYVTDYVSFNAGSERFRKIVFNIGDFAIFAGSLLALLGSGEEKSDPGSVKEMTQ